MTLTVTNSLFDGGAAINNGSALSVEAFDTASLTLSFTGSTANNGLRAHDPGVGVGEFRIVDHNCAGHLVEAHVPRLRPSGNTRIRGIIVNLTVLEREAAEPRRVQAIIPRLSADDRVVEGQSRTVRRRDAVEARLDPAAAIVLDHHIAQRDVRCRRQHDPGMRGILN